MGYYDEISSGYAELHRDEQKKKIDIIKKNLLIKASDRLLDVGCGPYFGDWGCDVVGIDPSKKLVELAEKKIHALQGRAEQLPFPDSYFDVVVSVTAAQNFTDLRKALMEIARVGKKRFAITILRRSSKADEFLKIMKEIFGEFKMISERKDLIAIVG